MDDELVVDELAAAIADGELPAWDAIDSSVVNDSQRETIARLRAIASVGRMFATLSGRADSLRSVRRRFTAGDTWGALRILEHIGRGRFGDVYRAWDPALEREVALKVVPSSGVSGAIDVALVEEGRLMARVHHPNVVAIHGAQRIGSEVGLSMELVKGHTLAAEFAERGPFAAEDLTRIGIDLCRALGAVHEAGLVHRDVKPQNVLRDERGRIVLGDFGTGSQASSELDAPTGLVGTPAYLAPEIYDGHAATASSDLYSLGTLLFHLASGRFPVEGRSIAALRTAHERGDRTPIDSLRKDLPASLTAVIDKALDPDPGRRFESAESMARALEACLPKSEGSSRRATRWLAAAALTMTLGAIAAAGWMARGPATPAVPFVARDFVLITAFENRTGESLLDGTLGLALERELSASTFVNVVSRGRVQDTLALMRQPNDTRIDAAVGREVAIRDGKIRALITGRVEKIGARYSVSTDVVTPEGATVATVREVGASDADLLAVIDRIAKRVRERLGESLAAIEASAASLPKVSTSSLRALQLYSQAHVIAGEEGGAVMANPRAVEQLLREALREDPQFVMAHILMAHAIRNDPGRQDESRKHADLALAAAEHGTAVDRGVARAEWHGIHGSFLFGAERLQHRERSAAAFEAVLELQPDHEWTLRCLTNVYPDLDRRADAVRATERLLQLRPNSLTVLWRAARAARENGEKDAARRYAERAAALDAPIDERIAYQAAWVRLYGAHQLLLQNRPREAAPIADRLAAELPSLAKPAHHGVATQLIPLYLMLGQVRRAEELVPFTQAQNQYLTRVLREREDQRRLRDAVARLYPSPASASNAISMVLDAGELRMARQALALVAVRTDAAPSYLHLVRGKLALIEDRPREALAHLQSAADGDEPRRGTTQWAATVKALVDAHAALDEAPRAIALLEEATRNRDEYQLDSTYTWLGLRDRLARMYREADRISDAEAVEAELLRLLAVADEDHPIKRRLESRINRAAR